MKNYILIEGKNFEKSRKEIKQNQGKLIIFSSEDEELNRKILEKENIDILLLNQSNKKDKLKQRDSGLNQVMAKIAKTKNIAIGINLDEIIHSEKTKRAKILGRIIQNVEICKKKKLKMVFFSKKENKNVYDLKALSLVLGMPTNMIKDF